MKSSDTGTRDNFNELHGNLGLTGLVVIQGNFVQDFSCILRSVFHCIHSGSLFGSAGVEECAVDGRSHVQFEEVVLGVFEFRFDGFVLGDELELSQEQRLGKQVDTDNSLSDGILEFVVKERNSIVRSTNISNLE